MVITEHAPPLITRNPFHVFLLRSVTSLLTAEITKLGNHHANQTIQIKSGDQTNYSTDIYYEVS